MESKKLTPKQTKFVEHYLANSGNDETLRVIASENLTKPNIASRMRARVEGTAADADEVLALLGHHLRGSFGELAPFFRDNGFFDLAACEAAGCADIIKEIQVSPVEHGGKVYFNVTVKIYDAQEAAGKLIHVLGLKQQPGENQRAEMRMKEIAQQQFERLQKEGWSPEEARGIVTDAHPRATEWIN